MYVGVPALMDPETIISQHRNILRSLETSVGGKGICGLRLGVQDPACSFQKSGYRIGHKDIIGIPKRPVRPLLILIYSKVCKVYIWKLYKFLRDKTTSGL